MVNWYMPNVENNSRNANNYNKNRDGIINGVKSEITDQANKR